MKELNLVFSISWSYSYLQNNKHESYAKAFIDEDSAKNKTFPDRILPISEIGFEPTTT